MIFVARYKDGSCGIADAANETEARSLLQSDEAWFNPENDKIISLRLLSSPYISRWFFEDVHSKELCEIARLSGMVQP